MLVKHIMITLKDLTNISLDYTVGDTLDLIDSKNLLSLPVVEGKKFVGVISKKYMFEEFFGGNDSKEEFLERKVSEFMKTELTSLDKNDLVESAVEFLASHNMQFIPVINEQKEFVGIVTHKAVFTVLKNALGIGYTRLVITTYDMKGRLAKLSELIARENGNIISIVQVDPKVMDLKEIILRVEVKQTQKLVKALNENGFTVRRIDE